MKIVLTKKEIKTLRKLIKELPDGIFDTEETMALLKRAKEAAKESGEAVIEFDDKAFYELAKKLDELDDDIEQIITDAAEATTETVEAAMSSDGTKDGGEKEKVLTAEEIADLPAKERWKIPIRSKKEQEEANEMSPFEVNFRPHTIDAFAEVDIMLYCYHGTAAAKVDKDGNILKVYAVRFPEKPSISLGDLTEEEIEALKRPINCLGKRGVYRKASLKEAIASMEQSFEFNRKRCIEKYGTNYEEVLPKFRITGNSWRNCPAASY